MAMYCSRYCCALAFILIISAQGMEVVARVHFSSSSYIVKEQRQICLELISDSPPQASSFLVSYSFSSLLIGGSGSRSDTRSDFLTFPANSATAQLCFRHMNDTVPCESSINGTVRLNDNSGVEIVEPSSALVIIQDDDLVSVQFDNAYYTITEGERSNEHTPVVISASHSIDMNIMQVSHMELPVHTSPQVSLSAGQNSLTLNIPNDNIALQEPRALVLQITPPAASQCSIAMTQNRTTILLMDDDMATVELTSSSGEVREGEEHSVCVKLNRNIARNVNFRLDIQPDSADLTDVETSSIPVRFTPDSPLLKCVALVASQDNVIESDEVLRVRLVLQTVLPASIQSNLRIGRSSATITIKDTSICAGVNLEPSKANSAVYVHPSRTICFTCNSCVSDLIWNLTSHTGDRWIGRTGETLQSTSSSADIGKVLPNGTLLLKNSSSVFSKTEQGRIEFSEQIEGNQESYSYSVIMGEAANVTELKIERMDTSVQFVCRYRGSPQPELAWLVDSRPIRQEELLGQVDSGEDNIYQSILFVHRTIAEKYSVECVATNTFGSDSLEGSLVAPTRPTATNAGLSAGTAVSTYLSLCVFSALLSHFFSMH